MIDRVPGLGVRIAYVTQMFLDALIKHKEWHRQTRLRPAEVRDWTSE